MFLRNFSTFLGSLSLRQVFLEDIMERGLLGGAGEVAFLPCLESSLTQSHSLHLCKCASPKRSSVAKPLRAQALTDLETLGNGSTFPFLF